MKSKVSLVAAADYNPSTVEEALHRVLEPLGGMEAFVRPGQRVLLKPNMLAGKTPGEAVTTHPEIVRAVIRLVQQAGGIVSVGDSPGVGTPQGVARKCGILEVIEETGATLAPFSESVKVKAGGTFHALEIAQDFSQVDVIINLPKLKTHQMMGLTCAVKNLFGAVVGLRKPRLHLQAGTDKKFFALMLLELAEHIAPALTIVDAVTGMEGDGPGSGAPVHIGVLIAGANPVAVDTVAGELVGFSSHQSWTWKVAQETGRPGSRLEEVELFGDPLQDLRPPSFKPAKTTDVNFGIKGSVKRVLKNALTARPEPLEGKCRLCGLCVKLCPPQVMKIRKGKLRIDYNQCIRCFCCHELCPHGALVTRQGMLLRLSRFIQG